MATLELSRRVVHTPLTAASGARRAGRQLQQPPVHRDGRTTTNHPTCLNRGPAEVRSPPVRMFLT